MRRKAKGCKRSYKIKKNVLSILRPAERPHSKPAWRRRWGFAPSNFHPWRTITLKTKRQVKKVTIKLFPTIYRGPERCDPKQGTLWTRRSSERPHSTSAAAETIWIQKSVHKEQIHVRKEFHHFFLQDQVPKTPSCRTSRDHTHMEEVRDQREP